MIDTTAIESKLKELIADEWIKQGHDLTGAFEAAIQSRRTDSNGDIVIEILDTTERGYGKILDDGVRAEQIRHPYAPARIKGLTNYAQLRLGLSGKQAISAAYAIATKHKQEGMPLPSSRRFSVTGKRTQFVADATLEIDKLIKETISKTISYEVLGGKV